nr:DUF1328 domain-containing protein [Paenibacillus sp. JDR-2]
MFHPRVSWLSTYQARQARTTKRASTPIERKVIHMLGWALLFFIFAIVAGLFGFLGIASALAGIAKILFVVFIVLFIASLILGRRRA